MPRMISGHFSFIIFKVVIDFSKIPFIRLLIPFLTGIIIYLINELSFDPATYLIGSFVLLAILFVYSNRSKMGTGKIFFLMSCDVFLFFAACYACYFIQPKNNPNYYGYYNTSREIKWIGTLDEIVNEKENFLKAIVLVDEVDDVKTTGELLVYFKKPIHKKDFVAGRKFEALSVITDIPSPLNPHEFDYKNYLANRRIYYQTFVDTGAVQMQNQFTGGLKYWGMKVKNSVVDFFNSGILSSESAQLCSALITGYDNEISRDTINAFAHSGTLHVLSVSGLHTGVLFAVLLFILNWLDRHNRFRILKLIILLCGLWLFVFIAGFSPPILRAAIMLSLIAIGKYYYNYLSNASVNIMGVSAFVLLLFDPYILFDTGFLLSYFALLGILIFEPPITSLYTGDNKIIRKIWTLCSVSIAAQISTLPITLYFFHQLPLWFVFSNLLVIPLCTLIMFLGIGLILKISFFAPLINLLTNLVYFLIGLTDTARWGYLDRIDFNFRDVLFLSSVITMLYWMIKYRRFHLVLGTLSLVISWQTFNLLEVLDKKQSVKVAVYHINKTSCVELKNKNKLLLDSTCSISEFEFHIKNNLTNYNYSNEITCRFNYVMLDTSRFLIVNSERDVSLVGTLNPNYVLIRNNVVLKPELLKKSGINKVIADGSCAYKTVKLLKQYCEQANISFHATRENGFLELPL